MLTDRAVVEADFFSSLPISLDEVLLIIPLRPMLDEDFFDEVCEERELLLGRLWGILVGILEVGELFDVVGTPGAFGIEVDDCWTCPSCTEDARLWERFEEEDL